MSIHSEYSFHQFIFKNPDRLKEYNLLPYGYIGYFRWTAELHWLLLIKDISFVISLRSQYFFLLSSTSVYHMKAALSLLPKSIHHWRRNEQGYLPCTSKKQWRPLSSTQNKLLSLDPATILIQRFSNSGHALMNYGSLLIFLNIPFQQQGISSLLWIEFLKLLSIETLFSFAVSQFLWLDSKN